LIIQIVILVKNMKDNKIITTNDILKYISTNY